MPSRNASKPIDNPSRESLRPVLPDGCRTAFLRPLDPDPGRRTRQPHDQLPPLTLSEGDCAWIERAFEAAIAASHQAPGRGLFARQDPRRAGEDAPQLQLDRGYSATHVALLWGS